jgi:dTDP-4-amino-4,6-dideoxygalactose transaminase
MHVPLVDLKAQYNSIGPEVERAVLRVLESQRFILGPEVEKFEREVATYCGCAHAIGCASGSDALLLALMALGVGPGQEVITTSFTFFATAGAVARLGAKPVFVDIEPSSFNINPNLIEDAITDKTIAILPVHLFGQCADMAAINDIARRRRLAVLEDAAQSIGAEYMGQRAGSLGNIAAFSFFPSKNLGGAGDGGMVTTNSYELAVAVRRLREHGAERNYYHISIGLNSRLDAIQAAILSVKLKHLDSWEAKRRDNARRYETLFAETGLLERELIKLPGEMPNSRHVYNQYVIRARDRDRLREYLKQKGIQTAIYYPIPLHLQPCFDHLGYRAGDLPHSERAASEALALPIYPELSNQAQEYVVKNITEFYRR